MRDNDELLWVEKYRPRAIEDCILPERIKSTFRKFVENRSFPNLLLTGSAGTGKTTVARALCNELDYEILFINASDERNIDVVRNKIKDFASTYSMNGKTKVIILDEADGLNATAQPALRAAMEEFHTCRFILTCNFENKLIDPIHSRTAKESFLLTKAEKTETMVQFLKRVFQILDTEEIQYDKKVVAELVKKHYPDNRRILNDLQRYATGGVIDTGILSNLVQGTVVKDLITMIKDKDFTKARQWIADNADADPASVFRQLYDNLAPQLTPETLPMAVLLLNQYQVNSATVADQEINMAAFAVELMTSVEFK